MGLLPPDTLDLLEKERGVESKCPAEAKWTGDPCAIRSRKGHAQQQRAGHRAHRDHLEHHGHHPLHRADLQEPVREEQPLRRLHRPQRRDGPRPQGRGLWTGRCATSLKYFDGELGDIDRIPEELKRKYATAFGIEFDYIIRAAARRQKWIDQSQSVNLFLGGPDLKTLSHMYRAAWRSGLKTTYYLRTLGASNIEKATVGVKKDKSPKDGEGKNFTEAEKKACSLDAMLNGGECEACQ